MRTALRYLNIYTLYGRLIRTTSYELGAVRTSLGAVRRTHPARSHTSTHTPAPAGHTPHMATHPSYGPSPPPL